MVKKSILGMVLALGLVACGGDNFSGKVSGYSLNAKEAIFLMTTDNTGGVVLISDQTGLCDKVKSNQAQNPPNATALSLFVTSSTSQGMQMPTTGTYPATNDVSVLVAAGNHSLATFEKSDANGNSIFGSNAPTASSGNVKITSLSMAANGHTNGTFDLTFGTDHVTGGFDALFCDFAIPTM